MINQITNNLKEGDAKQKHDIQYKRIKLFYVKGKDNSKKIDISNKEKLRKFFLHNFGDPDKRKKKYIIFDKNYSKYNKIIIHFKIKSLTGMGGLLDQFLPAKATSLILKIT